MVKKIREGRIHSEERDLEEGLPEGGASCTVCGGAMRNEYCVSCGKLPNECPCK